MSRVRKAPEPLAAYARKRDFTATPEPPGTKRGASKALRFVVQMHRASHLHYDFRLEAGGVLASWAVPKGPTLDTRERRLAMHVEDHPYDYHTFEGVIPAGNYGAGEVIVWDEGTYALAEGGDPVAEIAHGKIKFVLHGTKLRGMFTLVRIKPKDGERGDPWLLIKDHDAFADAGYDPAAHPESAKSGATLAALKAQPLPRDVKPMLATLADAPFDDPDWLFEVKWDGYRAIATIDARGAVALASRNGLDLLARFPGLASMGAGFRSLPVIVDGEICVLDARGHSSFGELQRGDAALTFVAFDLIYAEGRDLRSLPLEERKGKLEALVVAGHGVLYSKHIEDRGTAFFAVAKREGLEGIVAKRRSSPYRSTRSRDWQKIKARHEQEFVIGGWTEPKGSRAHFGALLLGYHQEGKLVFAGQVGTGFTQTLLREIDAELKQRERKTSPFAALPALNPPPHFVKAELVAQVAFAEWTADGLLRQPVFLGLRVDKAARDVTREGA